MNRVKIICRLEKEGVGEVCKSKLVGAFTEKKIMVLCLAYPPDFLVLWGAYFFDL